MTAAKSLWIQAFPVLIAGTLLLAPGCEQKTTGRISLIYDLKADPTEKNVSRIREMLADGDRDVRATALNALVSLEVEDASILASQAIGDEDGFVRATAAKLVGDLADPGYSEMLADLIRLDPERVVRQRAAEALARLGGEAALDGLSEGLIDPNQDVRLACVRGLKELDPGYAVPPLLGLLAADTAWEVRAQAATALGLSGDPAAIPGLQAALEDPNEFVRSAAANALRVGEELAARDERD